MHIKNKSDEEDILTVSKNVLCSISFPYYYTDLRYIGSCVPTITKTGLQHLSCYKKSVSTSTPVRSYRVRCICVPIYIFTD